MSDEGPQEAIFPYQVVALIHQATPPPTGTPLYDGPLGWIPNVALKRRFRLAGLDEAHFITRLEAFCASQPPFRLSFGQEQHLAGMPERMIEALPADMLRQFHKALLAHFGDDIISKYPEREGAHFMPHMTSSWRGRAVVQATGFTPTRLHHYEEHITHLYLVKDDPPGGADGRILRELPLGGDVQGSETTEYRA